MPLVINHPNGDHCRRLLRESIDKGVTLHTDVEVLQEVLYHRMRRTTRDQAVAECRELADTLVVHDVTLEVWHRATDLVESTALRGRDAFHAAAALLAGFDAIVTTDSDFDGVAGPSPHRPQGPLSYPDAAEPPSWSANQ